MDEVTARQLGERIVLVRSERGMSLGDLAEAAGLAKSYLSKIEKGEVLNPGLSTLTDVADALGVTVHDLLPQRKPGGKPKSPRQNQVEFETLTDSIPEPLREFLADQTKRGEPVPEDALRALAVLKLRGKRPESAADYQLLYAMIKRLIS